MKSSNDLYLEEINRIPLLTIDEEKELGKKIKNGDNLAINKMVEHNLRLVIPIAKLYLNRGLSFEDLIQYGNMGLMNAARKYDVEKGTKFSTYAVPWIKQSISRATENYSRNIRLPNREYRVIQKYYAEKQKYETLKGYKLSIEELADELNIDIDTIKKYEKLGQDTISLSTKTTDGDSNKNEMILEDIISNEVLIEDEIINRIRDEEILKLITKVIDNSRNLSIILDKYELLYSNQILGDKYNLSNACIGQIIRNNIKKLRRSNEILAFLDYALNENEVKEKLGKNKCLTKTKKN